MLRLSQTLQSAVILSAVAILFTSPSRGDAQSTSSILAALDQQIETKDLQTEKSLKDALVILEARLKVDGRKVPIIVDVESFKTENPDMPDIYEPIVQFPQFPERIKFSAAIRFTIDKVISRNATCVVMPDHILITTYSRVTPAFKLKQNVRGTYKGQLAAVLQELSENLGTTIVIDKRTGEKAKTEVAATFLSDTQLGSALRVFTEMAELKILVLDGVIMVTTPIHAESIRKEHQAKVEDYEKRRTVMEKMPLKTVPIPSPFSNFLGTSAQSIDLSSWFDPFWPYEPPYWYIEYGGPPRN